MLDLNHVLLFIAVISPLVLLARAHRAASRARGWKLAALFVLLITGAAWLVAPDRAGYLGGGAWLLLLVLPSAGMRRVGIWTLEQRFRPARRLASILRWLHPADGWIQQPELLRALELADAGERERALAILRAHASKLTAIGRNAAAQAFRIAQDWEGLVAWCRQIPPAILRQDFGLMPHFLRALGEVGELDELVQNFTAWEPWASRIPGAEMSVNLAWIPVLAFTGRAFELAELLRTELAKLPEPVRKFWFSTAASYSAQPEIGRAGLEQLREEPGARTLRPAIDDRLRRLNSLQHSLSPENARVLERLARARGRGLPAITESYRRGSPAVWAFILLNGAMFIAEIAGGGTTNFDTLHRLGALEPEAVLINHEYWRLLAALFLHFGPLHLAFNLYALFLLGPPLERAIGSIRFVACYLISGLGSSAGVVALRYLGWINADLLVGASGAVMGVVGAWAGALLRQRHAPSNRARLQNVLLIVALQTGFDLITPQVSLAAHLNGLLTGLVVGFLLAPADHRS